MGRVKKLKKTLLIGLLALTLASAQPTIAFDCKAPELICKAAGNQDRSLYLRDHCHYEQRLRVERFKVKDGQERPEETRETAVEIEPAAKADKSGQIPVTVSVISDTDKKGNPKSKVSDNETTLLSFGALWDLAFFPLLPEKIQYYNFQEIPAERKSERWYRFIAKAEVTSVPLASGTVMLDATTGEVLTIKIESLHNLEVLDKEAAKLRGFNATIDYSQFEGAMRLPTLASGSGSSNIRRFEGNFRFRFQEAKYRVVSKM
jgi:hypothetical protein